jgi:hypothetical protein
MNHWALSCNSLRAAGKWLLAVHREKCLAVNETTADYSHGHQVMARLFNTSPFSMEAITVGDDHLQQSRPAWSTVQRKIMRSRVLFCSVLMEKKKVKVRKKSWVTTSTHRPRFRDDVQHRRWAVQAAYVTCRHVFGLVVLRFHCLHVCLVDFIKISYGPTALLFSTRVPPSVSLSVRLSQKSTVNDNRRLSLKRRGMIDIIIIF